MPIDPEPVEGGNIELLENGEIQVVHPEAGVRRHVSHFVTCPAAKAWRGRKR